MNIFIDGEKKPIVGYPLQYKLNIEEYSSIRWQMIYNNGSSLTKSEENVLNSYINKSTVRISYLNYAAGKVFILKAWYKINENEEERVATFEISPIFGEPHIITSSWQDMEGYDVAECTLQDLYLTVRTANIPPEAKIEVLLYDKEKIGGNKYGGDFYGYVNTSGIAKIRITQSQWLKVRNQLYKKSSLGEDKQYQLYAKIRYTLSNNQAYDTDYPTVVESESPLLIMNNTESILAAKQRIDQSNKSVAIYQPDNIGFPDSKKSITLKIRVYFDGTGGNQPNVDKMLKAIEKHCGEAPDMNDYSPEAYKDAWKQYKDSIERNKEIIKEDIKVDPTDKDSSYNQAKTSIPKMRELDINNKDDKASDVMTIVVYASGVGTHLLGTDDTFFGMGTGSDFYESGIPSKVKEAMNEIKKELLKKKFNSKTEIIEKVEVSAFGFSRGAATTRNFVSQRQMLADTLSEVLSVKISTASIAYKLVGIFDTVCSVTDVWKLIGQGLEAVDPFDPQSKWYNESRTNNEILRVQQSNVEDYNLAMGGNVEKVIHLTAGDEYRAFFPLTDIESSIRSGCGYELKLPGSHCDIGGGDPDFVYEQIQEKMSSPNAPLQFIPRFVNAGWYNHSDIQRQEIRLNTPNYGTFTEYLYSVKRTVTVGYNRIPLRIMLHFIQDILKVNYDEEKLNKTVKIQEDLCPLQNELLSFAISNYANKRVSAVSVLNQPQFKELRKKYLHLSASPESGLTGKAMIKDMARRDKQGNPDRGILKG